MEQSLPLTFQVAFYTASGAVIVLAVVLVYVMLRLERQLDRVVLAVEHLEAELTPLARETRVVVDLVREISERVQRQGVAVETLLGAAQKWGDRAQKAADIADALLLSPLLAFGRTAHSLRTGAIIFLRSLWTAGRETQQKARVS